MNTVKRVMALLLAICVLLSVAGCGNGQETPQGSNGSDSTAPSGDTSGKTGVYNVTVETAGGMKMEGISVYVYADSNKTELVNFGETDAEGAVSFELPVSGDYAVELQGVPEGYELESAYPFAGNTAEITLSSSLITDKQLSEVSAANSLGLGDVMYDFTVTTPGGESVTLSQVLQEKKVVLLNFFFTTCGPCANEFPYMDEAYQMYQDKAAVIAVDPIEDSAAVATYQASMGLTFPMAACSPSWAQSFAISGYPTSVVIDRYGVICLIEVGGITNLSPFTSIFEHFTADDYQQALYPNGVADIMTQVKPNVSMESSEEIGAVLNQEGMEVTYRADGDEYAWPFVIAEKNGDACLMSTNKGIESSYSILYADVTLKAGQAVGLDYIVSTENGADILHVIVNDEAIFSISGADEEQAWKSCYPVVAEEDGVYEIALCYYKDESENVGDDTVYIRNLRIVNPDEIDTTAHLPRQAATSTDGFEYSYVDVVLNDKDGYYHVGSADGPLLLACLMTDSLFSEEQTVWDIVYQGNIECDGVNLYDLMLDYFSYASNSSLSGVCTVDYQLGEYLKQIAAEVGFDGTEQEWLKMCKYYAAYGKNAQQLEDPIKGLAPFSAYEAKLGKNVSTNFFYYNTAIIPRGKLAEFVPAKSGVYRITSRSESTQGVDGWIFDADRNELLNYEMDERMYSDSENVSMVFYMEAGKPYYIDIAFWDVYEVGYIYYDIEYVASSLEHFRLASPGYYTYDTNATGDAMYHLIAGGVDVELGDDGYYHVLLGKDNNGNSVLGSIMYADFIGVTGLFSNPITTVDSRDENGNVIRDEQGNPVKIKGMLDMGGFDFSKTEDDQMVIAYLEQNGNDPEATRQYLKEYWAEEYDANMELYQVEDVLAGIYHGEGEDFTEEIRGYQSRMYQGSATERVGCVPVDARLAEILQKLMDKYTFEGVDHSWTKLCYYYDYLGPQ